MILEHDLTAHERELLDRYVEGGAGAGRSVADNLRDWQDWRVVPRMFADVRDVDLSFELFGRRFAGPLLTAPAMGAAGLHPTAEPGIAAATARAGLPVVVPLGASRPLEEVAHAADGFLQQIYLPADRSALDPVVRRAVDAGALALVLTVDQPGLGGHPFRDRAEPLLRRFGAPNLPAGQAPASDLNPADVERLSRISSLPVLVKGVLRPDDARRAVEAGAAGVVVSNHGGRQVDGSVTAAQVLPGIVDALPAGTLVLADGGIRSGGDAFRALALGAHAVLIGRPVLRALGEGGPAAVTGLLERCLRELVAVAGNAGVARLSDLDRSFVSLHPRTRTSKGNP